MTNMPRVPLKVVHVVRQYAPAIGGIESFVGQLAAKQVEQGHKVRVVTLDRVFDAASPGPLPAAEVRGGVEVRRVPFKGSKRYPIAPQVLRHIEDADVVHVHAVDFFCDFLSLTRWLHKKPLVLTTHGGFFHTDFMASLKRAYFNTVTRATLTGYGAVVACSAEDERIFRQIRKSGLVEITNAVDTVKFAGLAARQGRTLIYFGRLAPNKEVPKLLRWFAGLAASGDWRLIVAGKPMGVDPADLERQVRDLGLSDRVSLRLTPSDAELGDLIRDSSVYVCASSFEGFGLAAVEAASAGLYPLLSDIPPFRATIERLGFGGIVDFDAPATWPASYAELDERLARFRAEVTPQRVVDAVASFSWDGAAAQYERLYLEVSGRSRRRLGPVAVDVRDHRSAAAEIVAAAEQRRPAFWTFCNAHTVNVAANDPRLRSALHEAQVLNDGVGADIASRMLYGERFPENLNGTDFVPRLLAESTGQLSVFVLGSTPEVAQRAAELIAQRYPQVRVAGFNDGFFGAAGEAEVREKIVASGANLVLVGMGQPLQELWAARNYKQLPAVTICVGALLDFIAGRVVRAPDLLRRLRAEWLFRLAQEPKRLASRYLLGNPVFLARMLGQYVRGYRA